MFNLMQQNMGNSTMWGYLLMAVGLILGLRMVWPLLKRGNKWLSLISEIGCNELVAGVGELYVLLLNRRTYRRSRKDWLAFQTSLDAPIAHRGWFFKIGKDGVLESSLSTLEGTYLITACLELHGAIKGFVFIKAVLNGVEISTAIFDSNDYRCMLDTYNEATGLLISDCLAHACMSNEERKEFYPQKHGTVSPSVTNLFDPLKEKEACDSRVKSGLHDMAGKPIPHLLPGRDLTDFTRNYGGAEAAEIQRRAIHAAMGAPEVKDFIASVARVITGHGYRVSGGSIICPFHEDTPDARAFVKMARNQLSDSGITGDIQFSYLDRDEVPQMDLYFDKAGVPGLLVQSGYKILSNLPHLFHAHKETENHVYEIMITLCHGTKTVCANVAPKETLLFSRIHHAEVFVSGRKRDDRSEIMASVLSLRDIIQNDIDTRPVEQAKPTIGREQRDDMIARLKSVRHDDDNREDFAMSDDNCITCPYIEGTDEAKDFESDARAACISYGVRPTFSYPPYEVALRDDHWDLTVCDDDFISLSRAHGNGAYLATVKTAEAEDGKHITMTRKLVVSYAVVGDDKQRSFVINEEITTLPIVAYLNLPNLMAAVLKKMANDRVEAGTDDIVLGLEPLPEHEPVLEEQPSVEEQPPVMPEVQNILDSVGKDAEVIETFTHQGLECKVVEDLGMYLGYVAVPADHMLHGTSHLDEDGQLVPFFEQTSHRIEFSGPSKEDPDSWLFGFDNIADSHGNKTAEAAHLECAELANTLFKYMSEDK